MSERVHLAGRYKIMNESILREKAGRENDPRHIFYEAMLENNSYAAYLAEVGQTLVNVEGYKANPISGRMEILYARKYRWVVDA